MENTLLLYRKKSASGGVSYSEFYDWLMANRKYTATLNNDAIFRNDDGSPRLESFHWDWKLLKTVIHLKGKYGCRFVNGFWQS